MSFISVDCKSSGFCNRLFKWQIIYDIAKINNKKVLVDWPKEYFYLNIPNTEYGKIESIGDFKSFRTDKLKDYKLDEGNYQPTCNWEYDRTLQELHDKNRDHPIMNISLKSDVIKDSINNVTSELVGLHVRRGDYVHSDTFNINVPYRVPDSWYLNMCEQILSINPNVKFYLASDGTEDELKIFKEKLNIVDYKSIINDNNTPNHLIDLFSLANCKMIIGSTSTFSYVAHWYKQRLLITPWVEDQKINKEKIKNIIL